MRTVDTPSASELMQRLADEARPVGRLDDVVLMASGWEPYEIRGLHVIPSDLMRHVHVTTIEPRPTLFARADESDGEPGAIPRAYRECLVATPTIAERVELRWCHLRSHAIPGRRVPSLRPDEWHERCCYPPREIPLELRYWQTETAELIRAFGIVNSVVKRLIWQPRWTELGACPVTPDAAIVAVEVIDTLDQPSTWLLIGGYST